MSIQQQQHHREQQQVQPGGGARGDEYNHGVGSNPTIMEAVVETRCPQPRRAYAALFPSAATGNSLVAGSCFSKMPGSPSARSQIAEEASNELRDLLVGGGGAKDDRFSLADSMVKETNAPVVRPLSSVSTCAGPTPTPEDRAATPMSQWFMPDRFATPTLEEPYDIGSSVGGSRAIDRQSPSDHSKHQQQNSNNSGNNSNNNVSNNVSSMNRKVFVGGIPQDMNQDEIYTIFAEFSAVKKAWLQRYRPNNAAEHGPPHNHRGFGFVIFYESSAVDQMLGSDYSRFIPVRDNGRLEVKRAVSSGDIANAAPNAPQARSKSAQNSNAPASQSTWQQSTSTQAQQVLMPQMPSMSWPTNSNGSLQSGGGVVSSAQQLPANAVSRGAPSMHALPVSGSDAPGHQRPMLTRRGSGGVNVANQTMNISPSAQIMSPVPAPWVPQGVTPSWSVGIPDSRSSTPGHVNTGPSEYGSCAGVSAAMIAQQALMTPEPRQLGYHDLDSFKQELASVLRNAMPDHYDD